MMAMSISRSHAGPGCGPKTPQDMRKENIQIVIRSELSLKSSNSPSSIEVILISSHQFASVILYLKVMGGVYLIRFIFYSRMYVQDRSS